MTFDTQNYRYMTQFCASVDRREHSPLSKNQTTYIPNENMCCPQSMVHETVSMPQRLSEQAQVWGKNWRKQNPTHEQIINICEWDSAFLDSKNYVLQASILYKII